MAYTHTRYIVQLGTAILASGTGDKSTRWSPAFVPHIVRAVIVTQGSTKTKVTKPVFSFRTATMGKASATGGQFKTVTLVSAAAQGKVKYVDKLNTEVKPGDAVVVNVTTAATVAYPVSVALYVEPRWETPANNTRMATG